MFNGNFVNNINEFICVINILSIFIDLVLLILVVKVYEFGVFNIDLFVSDYKVIYIFFFIDIEFNCVYECNIWVYKDVDFEKLNFLIFNCDWDIIINSVLNIDVVVV